MSIKALRYNEGKPQLSYMLDAPLAMKGMCKRFELGAKKYYRDNWKLGLEDKALIDCLMRHLLAYANGEFLCEEFDKDGNSLGFQPHVDAIVWNAVVLSEQYHRNQIKEIDG